MVLPGISIRLITDDQGLVINQYDYDAYGRFETLIEGVANPYTYTGRELDAESGLYYYRLRYYDPQTGRFISEDRIGMQDTVNMYAYVNNNPTGFIDPYGLWSTAAHNFLVDRFADRLGLTDKQRRAMKEGSRNTDSLANQTDANVYKHAMTSDEIPEKSRSCQMANDFIANNISEFNALKDRPDSRRVGKAAMLPDNETRAYRALGRAMHTVMDDTSPAHRGFQFWESGQVKKHGPSKFLGLNREDTVEDLDDLQGLSLDADGMGAIEETLQNMFDSLNGSLLRCSNCE